MFSVIRLSNKTLTEKYHPSLYNYFYEIFPNGFWICEKNYKIIGFIIGIKTNIKIARILMLSVKKEHRRQGIASYLLKNFIKEISTINIKQIELEVKRKNISAIKFYQKNGFEIVDIVENFYQNNEDAYIMKLII
jgi:ribosomal-protein-alanine acetyltransferase